MKFLNMLPEITYEQNGLTQKRLKMVILLDNKGNGYVINPQKNQV